MSIFVCNVQFMNVQYMNDNGTAISPSEVNKYCIKWMNASSIIFSSACALANEFW